MNRRLALVLLALVLLAALAAGCAQAPAPTATAPQNCGAENLGYGAGYDAAARDCLWKAFQRKEAATFVSTQLTVEGDPIVRTVKMHAPDRIDVILDSTRDKFGEQKVSTWPCRSMERTSIERNGHLEFYFRIKGCAGEVPVVPI